jgi:hypothetical protein
MCAGCALAAMTGASATRSWLQAQHVTWLTPRRMRVVTVALFTAATIGSSATLGGSGAAPAGSSHHAGVVTHR